MKKITEKQLKESVASLRSYMNTYEAYAPNTNPVATPTATSSASQPAEKSWWDSFMSPNNNRGTQANASQTASHSAPLKANDIWHDTNQIKAFQQKNGLKVDGFIGPQTMMALAKQGIQPPAGFQMAGKKAPTTPVAKAPAAAPSTSTAPVSSGDPALDARIADNAAYFKNRQTVAQPTTPAATQTAYNSAVTPTNLTYAKESKQFTNTIDEMRYYSEILAEAQLSELNVGKAMDALSGVKAGLQGKHIPQSMDPATGRFGSTSQVAKDARSFTKEYAPKIGAGIGAAGAGVAAYQGDGSNAYSTGTSNPVLDTIPQGTPENPYGNVPQAIQHPHPDMTSAQDDMASTDQFNSDQAAQKLNDLGKPTASLPNMNTGNLPQSPKLPGTSTKAQDAPKPNPKVKEAQKILIQFGYLPKGADTGVMDNVTKDAQRQFQTAYKSGPQPVNPTAPMMEHVSFGEMDSLARIIQLAKI